MARTRASRQIYADLLERYGRAVADAFFRALDTLRAGVELQRVTAALQNNDIEAVLEALHIDPEAFNEIPEKARQAHEEAGKVTAQAMPKRNPDGTALVVRFDGRNPEAEAWLSLHSSDLITRITTEQRDLVRATLTESMRRGVNPRQAALEIVGKVNRATGKREGGILGLSKPQAEYVASARTELGSTDPASLQNYLHRKRRNKQYDGHVRRALKTGKPIPAEAAGRMIRDYERSLLKQRGELIGLHETFSALEQGKQQAYKQAVAAGKIAESAVTKTWRALSVRNYRHQHRAINGQKVGLNGLFVLSDGTTMQHPHDKDAPVSHTAGCRCQADYSVDFYANLR
ncbi:MAG: head morphogenesis protein [Alphaproteobacteria bacterium]|uniref:Capsid morphogenesis protein n=1 Tax=viral metagenome TaxID=1070528 RepID=A0A6H1ZBF1_9ZZZZ|nr:head morphogenesis protein [Alphaproteobacteria bacterium]